MRAKVNSLSSGIVSMCLGRPEENPGKKMNVVKRNIVELH